MVYVMLEGIVVFFNQLMLRVEGLILQCQLVEIGLFMLINFFILLVIKVVWIVDVVQGDSVLEFGMCCFQGLDGVMMVAWVIYIGGVYVISNVMVGCIYGIFVKGMYVYSWVMAYEDELLAFW